MGRTACTEPQCLYKGTLYFTLLPSICLRLLARLPLTSIFFFGNLFYKVVPTVDTTSPFSLRQMIYPECFQI